MRELKVILIDDEMLIRKLIRMKLNTEGMGLTIVGEYSNGASALKEIETVKPDIVISDICMPEEDGISFSEKCLKIYPKTKIVIVTGYDDFDYACRSLKAGVSDYLMKPVQTEELNDTMKKIVEEIRKEEEAYEKQKYYIDEIKQNLPALRSIYLNQILLEDTAEEHIKRKLMNYNVEINDQKEHSLQIAILITAPEFTGQLLEETERFFESEKYVHVVQDSWARIIVINNDTQIPFSECLKLLTDLMGKKYQTHMQEGLSEMVDGWGEVRKAYILALDHMQKNHDHTKPKESKQEWEKLLICLREGQIEKALACLQEQKQNIENVYSFFQMLCIQTEVNKNKLRGVNERKNCHNREEELCWIKNMVKEIALRKAIEAEPEKGLLVEQILCFMEENMGNEELNMNIVAEHFSMSNSYLSRMLKQWTGQTYGELLSDLRLRRMKDLLCNTDMRCQDVGIEIGICDAHYLSIWFRKMTGYSVTEFKKCNKNETFSSDCAE